ncbi:MAG: pantoate--beta-alanine ligase [Deltaproteobacteria bacterium]
MVIVKSPKQMQAAADEAKRAGKSIAFVPTMGALHEGHLRLFDEGKRRGDILVASVFVNPSQFGPNEDFSKYPRDIESDAEKARLRGADIVFAPAPSDIYPEGFETWVEVGEMAQRLCGIFRPGHFRGVATVALKLFNIVKPNVAIFGEKDYQQLKIIERMARDFNLDIEIVGFPIVREEGGIAMSSRNKYLSAEDRARALAIPAALNHINAKFAGGETNAETLTQAARAILLGSGIDSIDYIEICSPDTLRKREIAEPGDVVALAARVGATRLLDNIKL